MLRNIYISTLIIIFFHELSYADLKFERGFSGNPVVDGWYADPQIRIYNGKYWIFATTSDLYDNQLYMDCFSSDDLVTWTKHRSIINSRDIKWLNKALWAPDSIEKDGKYYLFFSCNDTYPIDRYGGNFAAREASDEKYGGIGVAVADAPEGPYKDLIGKPLIDKFWNAAQPIDQYVFEYEGAYYMLYGGWRKCNIVKLSDDFKTLEPFEDGSFYKDMTPEKYVEGPVIFKRKGKWYFMWSEGHWGDSTYKVAYGVAETPFGPFKRIGAVLTQDKEVATGAGHHSVLNIPGTDDWYICYHRRPIPNYHRDHRVICIDKMNFDSEGKIQPIKMTFKGVESRRIGK